MVTIDCPPQILVVLDNRKGLITNAGGGGAATSAAFRYRGGFKRYNI